MFQLMIWKEFKNKKMQNVAEIISAEKGTDAITSMMQMNAQARKTTTGYQVFPIEELLKKKGILLKQQSGSVDEN